jgi:polyprenyl-phospho-N-acetylgalactosaminyl synthase
MVFTFIQTMSNLTDHSKVFVIVPVYNESEIIISVLQGLIPFDFSIVVIDDGSTCDIYSLIKTLPVYYLRHQVNLGQGAALQTGIEFAISRGAEYIATFDGDGQHRAEDVDRLLNYLVAKNLDIVLGSRFREDSYHNMLSQRKYLLQLARYLNFLFTGLLLSDAHNGLRVMSASTAKLLRITENRMAHATEILSKIRIHRLKYKELPVQVFYTNYTRQKGQNLWSGFRIIFDLLLNRIFG